MNFNVKEEIIALTPHLKEDFIPSMMTEENL